MITAAEAKKISDAKNDVQFSIEHQVKMIEEKIRERAEEGFKNVRVYETGNVLAKTTIRDNEPSEKRINEILEYFKKQGFKCDFSISNVDGYFNFYWE